MKFHVCRLGDAVREATVEWRTVERNAIDGVSYEGKGGTITFKPGSIIEEVKITILRDERVTGTTEFGLILENPKGCVIGKYLCYAVCKIIDYEKFPSTLIGEAYEKKARIDHSYDQDVSLFNEYLKCNFKYPQMRNATIFTCATAQLFNVYQILKIYIIKRCIYLLVESHATASSRKTEFAVWAFVYCVPYALHSLLENIQGSYMLPGDSRSFLQTLLLKKFFHYSQESRLKVPLYDLLMASIQDAHSVVHNGYMSMISFANHSALVLYLAIFLIGSTEADTLATVLAVVMPLLYVFVLVLRKKEQHDLCAAEFEGRDRLISRHIMNSVFNFPIISGFDRIQKELKQYEDNIEEFNELERQANTFSKGGPLAIIIYSVSVVVAIGIGGQLAIDGDISVSTFFVIIAVVIAMEMAFAQLFEDNLRINSSFHSLANITKFINTPIDIPHRLVANRQRRYHGKELREKLRRGIESKEITHSADELAADLMKLEVRTPGLNLEFGQGEIIALCGDMREEQTKLLKFLSYNLFPAHSGTEVDAPLVFVPTHLRVVEVGENPQIMNTSVYNNLIYGFKVEPKGDGLDATTKRIQALLLRLGVSDDVTLHLNDEYFVGAEGTKLSKDDQVALHFARVFIMNPEVILLHEPFTNVAPEKAEKIMELLYEFVEKRGVIMEPFNEEPFCEEFVRRRKRTVIFTAKSNAFKVDKTLTVRFPEFPYSPMLLLTESDAVLYLFSSKTGSSTPKTEQNWDR